MAIKQQKPKRPPKTLMEKRYVRALATAPNGTEAARIAGYSDPEQSAWDNKRKLDLVSIMESQGLTDERLFSKLDEGLESNRVISANIVLTKSDDPTVEDQKAHSMTKDFIDVPDMPTRHKYLETALKMKGHLQPQGNVQVDVNMPIAIMLSGAKEQRE